MKRLTLWISTFPRFALTLRPVIKNAFLPTRCLDFSDDKSEGSLYDLNVKGNVFIGRLIAFARKVSGEVNQAFKAADPFQKLFKESGLDFNVSANIRKAAVSELIEKSRTQTTPQVSAQAGASSPPPLTQKQIKAQQTEQGLLLQKAKPSVAASVRWKSQVEALSFSEAELQADVNFAVRNKSLEFALKGEGALPKSVNKVPVRLEKISFDVAGALLAATRPLSFRSGQASTLMQMVEDSVPLELFGFKGVQGLQLYAKTELKGLNCLPLSCKSKGLKISRSSRASQGRCKPSLIAVLVFLCQKRTLKFSRKAKNHRLYLRACRRKLSTS